MRGRFTLVLGAVLLMSATAPPKLPTVTRVDLASFGKDHAYRAYPQQPVADWDRDLRAAVAPNGPDGAADRLAPKYGLSASAMRELVKLWITVDVHHSDIERDPAMAAEARRRLLALLPATGRAPLVLQAVGEALDRLSDCSQSDADAMMRDSTDPAGDSWQIANSATCGDNFLRAASVPGHAMAGLIRLADYGTLKPRDALPVYAWLTSAPALDRVAEADRPALAGFLNAHYARLLFNTGLIERAVALIDGLSPDMRARTLSPDPVRLTARVDGLPVTIKREGPDESLRFDLAAAYALAGRTTEAEAEFAAMKSVAAARTAFDCAWRDRKPDAECASSRDVDMSVLLLDHLLHDPSGDAYPLAETLFAGGTMGASSDAGPALLCRVFEDARFAEICDDARRDLAGTVSLAADDDRDEEQGRMRAGLAALALPGFAETRDMVAREFRRIAAANGGDADSQAQHAARETVTPRPRPSPRLRCPKASARHGPGRSPGPRVPPASRTAMPRSVSSEAARVPSRSACPRISIRAARSRAAAIGSIFPTMAAGTGRRRSTPAWPTGSPMWSPLPPGCRCSMATRSTSRSRSPSSTPRPSPTRRSVYGRGGAKRTFT